MPENVRLVIWDLDDTFWAGTVSEGGIERYVQEHHDLVIALAERGIISTICSKNDAATVMAVLREKQIDDYFVLPSISWEPKGVRLSALIETFQLRPATVMFIDDNPNNRAEASALIPDLQVESELFIQSMLDDPRFKGKDDRKLTRLTQYKLLEMRKRDEKAATGSNEDFLRNCDVRVQIEYDIPAYIDRAIELVNRTNQLNYTKRRLPEDPAAARRQLLGEISSFAHQAGLVRVVDKYGDYGFVGLFVTETRRQTYVAGTAMRSLRHFCFSCRTLGMLVEQWMYEYLGRPELQVVGEVLTDLSVKRTVDWIRLVSHAPGAAIARKIVAPEIRVYGGCEANPLGVYLGAHTDKVEVLGNYASNGLFVRINSAPLALSMFDRSPAVFAAEAESLGMPLELAARDFFADAPTGTAFVLSCGFDAGDSRRMRHKQHGWQVAVEINGDPQFNLVRASADEVAVLLEQRPHLRPPQKERISRIAAHLREHYSYHVGMSESMRRYYLQSLIDRVPEGSRLILVLDHDEIRHPDGIIRPAKFVRDYNTFVRDAVRSASYVAAVAFSDAITSHGDIQKGGNHYERMVYLRVAQAIVSKLQELPARIGLNRTAA